MRDKRWSQLINWNEYYLNKNCCDYESDNEEEIKTHDLNLIDFSLNNEKILNEIDKILQNYKFSNMTSLEILKNQDLISSYISKSIQNNLINKNFFIKNIIYLRDSSKYLSEKIKQNLFNHNLEYLKKDKIIRSSYKFCNFKQNCNYNYESGKKGCYADHYPHNMIYADCLSLIECINKYYKEEDEIQNKEIMRCINTISFVIKHMYDELNNLCMYSKRNEHDKFHFVKSNNKKFQNVKYRKIL